jgi:hypothetical protein
MGLDDILREKQEQTARNIADMAKAPAIAQGRRLAFADRVTRELIEALKATGDPALSSPMPIKVMGALGVSSAVQVECHSQSGRSVFICTVTCGLGEPEAKCSDIEIILPNGSRGTFQPTSGTALKYSGVPESAFSIDVTKLRSLIHSLATKGR